MLISAIIIHCCIIVHPLHIIYKYKNNWIKLKNEVGMAGSKSTQTRDNYIYYTSLRLLFSTIVHLLTVNHGWCVCWVRYVGDIHAGCSLVVIMVRVYQFWFNRIITGHLCTPQKASVGMYSRCNYLLFVYFLILPSLLHSSILFNCFYTCFCSFLLHLVKFIDVILHGLLTTSD